MPKSKLSDEEMHVEVLHTGFIQQLEAWSAAPITGERLFGGNWDRKRQLFLERMSRLSISNMIKREDSHPHKQSPDHWAIKRWEDAFSKVLGEENHRLPKGVEKIFKQEDTKTGKTYYLRFRRYPHSSQEGKYLDGLLIAEEIRGDALTDPRARNPFQIGYSDMDVISQTVINRGTGMVDSYILSLPNNKGIQDHDIYQIGSQQVLYPNAAKQTAIHLLHTGEQLV